LVESARIDVDPYASAADKQTYPAIQVVSTDGSTACLVFDPRFFKESLVNHRVALLFLPAALAAISSANYAIAEDVAFAGWQTDANRAWQSAQVTQRPLLLYITTENCVYCRKMERESWSNLAVAEDIRRQFVAANVNARNNEELVRKLKVSAYPTTVVIAPNRGVVEYIRGYVPPQELHVRLAAAARRSQLPTASSAR